MNVVATSDLSDKEGNIQIRVGRVEGSIPALGSIFPTFITPQHIYIYIYIYMQIHICIYICVRPYMIYLIRGLWNVYIALIGRGGPITDDHPWLRWELES